MLLLKFYLGDEPFVLDARLVEEVVPLVNLRAVAGAPDYVAGLFNFRGTIVPVIDLCKLTTGRACYPRLSTRIIVARHSARDGGERTLGLMVERVTEALQGEKAELATSEIMLDASLNIGEIACDEGGMLQCLNLDRTVPPELEDLALHDESDDDGTGTEVD